MSASHGGRRGESTGHKGVSKWHPPLLSTFSAFPSLSAVTMCFPCARKDDERIFRSPVPFKLVEIRHAMGEYAKRGSEQRRKISTNSFAPQRPISTRMQIRSVLPCPSTNGRRLSGRKTLAKKKVEGGAMTERCGVG